MKNSILILTFLIFSNTIFAQKKYIIYDSHQRDILLGKNMIVFLGKAKKQTLNLSLTNVMHHGCISYGNKSSLLIKNPVTVSKILYISPLVSKELSEQNPQRKIVVQNVWTLVNNVGGDLGLMEPFTNIKESVIIAEPIEINNKLVLKVLGIKPKSYFENLKKVIKGRKEIDKEIDKKHEKWIEEKSRGIKK